MRGPCTQTYGLATAVCCELTTMKLPPLLRSAACWTLLLALAGLLRPTAGYLSTNSDTCSLPMAPQFLALPRCQPTTKTLEDAKAGAPRHVCAPVVMDM